MWLLNVIWLSLNEVYIQISILDENKPTADNAAIRGLAIDHLGSLASNLRSFEMTYNGGVQALSLQQVTFI
jgi:hypothetical protein